VEEAEPAAPETTPRWFETAEAWTTPANAQRTTEDEPPAPEPEASTSETEAVVDAPAPRPAPQPEPQISPPGSEAEPEAEAQPEAEAEHEPEAQPEPEPERDEQPEAEPEAPARGLGTRGVLRRRARYLRQLHELQLRDLGGFLLELHRFGRERPELVRQKLEAAQRTEEDLRALEEALGRRHRLREVREAGIAGTCSRCGAIHGSGERFCSSCGSELQAGDARR
jgi:hypothetical protein